MANIQKWHRTKEDKIFLTCHLFSHMLLLKDECRDYATQNTNCSTNNYFWFEKVAGCNNYRCHTQEPSKHCCMQLTVIIYYQVFKNIKNSLQSKKYYSAYTLSLPLRQMAFLLKYATSAMAEWLERLLHSE